MKRGTPTHPKTLTLAAALGIERWGAAGVLECLWHFASQYARRGDIGRHKDVAIAQGIGWSGNPEKLIAALVESGWLDRCACHRLKIHDWPEHVDQSVGRSKEVVGSGYVECYGSPSEKLENPSENLVSAKTEKADGYGYGSVVKEGVQGEGTRSTGDPARVSEGHALIAQVAKAANLDPSEVLERASRWRGQGYVRLDSMSPPRLDHTIISLRRWLRTFTGEAEPELPQARAAPVLSDKAQARAATLRASMLGGLKGDGSISVEALSEGFGLGKGMGGTLTSLPAAGGSRGTGRD